MNILEDNESFCFWEEQNIICNVYKKNVIDIDVARLGVSMRLRVSERQPCAMYVDMQNVNKVTKEARDYYITEEATQLILATAVYTPSVLTKIITTFFLNFNKPKMPFKMFSSKEKALEWLKDYYLN
jgi:hypothetical protein